MDLLSLPVVMIENIFSFLTYDEIAKNRVVCRPFNDICCRMLNRGFLMIERRHGLALKTVKGQLPRRESERRYHPLSRHCDILSSIETRISMLNMTYAKFIDNGICCFIPGKVIDEIKRVLALVESSTTPPRAHEVLQELRDISSMAIEHFDDKISPALKQRLREHLPTPHHPAQTPNALGPVAMKQEIQHIKRRSILNARLSLYLASQYKKFYKRMAPLSHILYGGRLVNLPMRALYYKAIKTKMQQKWMISYKRVALRQRRTIKDLTQKHIDQDAAIADLKKRIEECDTKYSELTHTNQAVGASSTKVVPQSAPAQPLRHFASQIKLDLSHLPIGTGKRTHGKLPNMKPRKPIIRLPSISESQEPPPIEPRARLPTAPKASEKKRTNQPQKSLEKVDTITKEIKNITKCEINLRSNKRSQSMCDGGERKKMKLD